MERIAVTSSMVRSVGYEPAGQLLEVEYVSAGESRIYQYAPVDQEQFDALVDPANSVGRLINALKADPEVASIRVFTSEVR